MQKFLSENVYLSTERNLQPKKVFKIFSIKFVFLFIKKNHDKQFLCRFHISYRMIYENPVKNG